MVRGLARSGIPAPAPSPFLYFVFVGLCFVLRVSTPGQARHMTRREGAGWKAQGAAIAVHNAGAAGLLLAVVQGLRRAMDPRSPCPLPVARYPSPPFARRALQILAAPRARGPHGAVCTM